MKLKIFAASLAGLTLSGPALAEPGLAGAWSGGGWVAYAGQRERAACRVRYVERSRGNFVMSGTCATASGRVSQNANLRRVGATTFAGQFYNTDFNISGAIRVVLRDGVQEVKISGGGSTAELLMKR